MSDKTKYLADQKRIEDRLREEHRRNALKPKFEPKCWCGAPGPIHIYRNTLRAYFVCGRHVPDEMR